MFCSCCTCTSSSYQVRVLPQDQGCAVSCYSWTPLSYHLQQWSKSKEVMFVGCYICTRPSSYLPSFSLKTKEVLIQQLQPCSMTTMEMLLVSTVALLRFTSFSPSPLTKWVLIRSTAVLHRQSRYGSAPSTLSKYCYLLQLCSFILLVRS